MPKISEILSSRFIHDPTRGQKDLFRMFDLLLEKNGPDTLLIRGYAGTGKTSIVSSLVRILPLFNFKSILLAPTGRAAKVLANYSGRKAFTIHRIIYVLNRERETGVLSFRRIKNYHKNTVFIVDEASMIHDQYSATQDNLLRDLKEYVFESGSNKLVILGDTAQLPPVGQELSGALEKVTLEMKYGLKVESIELDEVVRQEKESGILENATRIRRQIHSGQFSINFHTSGYRDIFSINSGRLEDGLRYAYEKYGPEQVIIICRSNRQANQFNQYIRRNILYLDERIDAGDHLMIVRNNYFWLDEKSTAGFLANGDFAEVRKIGNVQEIYGFTFADLDLQLVDYPMHPVIRVKAILDTLESGSAALGETESRRLYDNVREDYAGLTKKDLSAALAADPYLNAVQVKFTYAITCHKSQGGQWAVVFLDQGYLNDSNRNINYMKWLYTGMTRATRELYLVNFLPEFFARDE